MKYHIDNKMLELEIDECTWNKDRNQFIFPSSALFPRQVRIHNPKSKAVRIYYPITPDDTRYDHDCWDGEQMIYKTTESTNGADYLVIYRNE